MSTNHDETEPPAYDEQAKKMLQCEITLKLKRELDMICVETRRSKSSIVRQALEEFSERNNGPVLAKAAEAERFEKFIWIRGRF